MSEHWEKLYTILFNFKFDHFCFRYSTYSKTVDFDKNWDSFSKWLDVQLKAKNIDRTLISSKIANHPNWTETRNSLLFQKLLSQNLDFSLSFNNAISKFKPKDIIVGFIVFKFQNDFIGYSIIYQSNKQFNIRLIMLNENNSFKVACLLISYFYYSFDTRDPPTNNGFPPKIYSSPFSGQSYNTISYGIQINPPDEQIPSILNWEIFMRLYHLLLDESKPLKFISKLNWIKGSNNVSESLLATDNKYFYKMINFNNANSYSDMIIEACVYETIIPKLLPFCPFLVQPGKSYILPYSTAQLFPELKKQPKADINSKKFLPFGLPPNTDLWTFYNNSSYQPDKTVIITTEHMKNVITVDDFMCKFMFGDYESRDQETINYYKSQNYDFENHFKVEDYATIWIQLLYVVYCFSLIGLKHGDFHTQNMFLSYIPDGEVICLQFKTNNVQFKTFWKLKVFDFDYSDITGLLFNDKEIGFCEERGIMCPVLNPYSDIYRILRNQMSIKWFLTATELEKDRKAYQTKYKLKSIPKLREEAKDERVQSLIQYFLSNGRITNKIQLPVFYDYFGKGDEFNEQYVSSKKTVDDKSIPKKQKKGDIVFKKQHDANRFAIPSYKYLTQILLDKFKGNNITTDLTDFTANFKKQGISIEEYLKNLSYDQNEVVLDFNIDYIIGKSPLFSDFIIKNKPKSSFTPPSDHDLNLIWSDAISFMNNIIPFEITTSVFTDDAFVDQIRPKELNISSFSAQRSFSYPFQNELFFGFYRQKNINPKVQRQIYENLKMSIFSSPANILKHYYVYKRQHSILKKQIDGYNKIERLLEDTFNLELSLIRLMNEFDIIKQSFI